jgi:hypothetical protein
MRRIQFKKGQRFALLTVLRFAGINKRGETTWLCRCDCGKKTTVPSYDLRTGHTKSCGHLQVRTTHGMCYSPEYYAFCNAWSRCNYEWQQCWPDYGGRGIKFLFETFEEFFKEVGLRPGPNYTLERIDNNGNYEKGNVRWATRHEQNMNRRNMEIEGFETGFEYEI